MLIILCVFYIFVGVYAGSKKNLGNLDFDAQPSETPPVLSMMYAKSHIEKCL